MNGRGRIGQRTSRRSRCFPRGRLSSAEFAAMCCTRCCTAPFSAGEPQAKSLSIQVVREGGADPRPDVADGLRAEEEEEEAARVGEVSHSVVRQALLVLVVWSLNNMR